MIDVAGVVVVLMAASWAAFITCPALAFYCVWRWGRPPRHATRAYLAAMMGFVVGLGLTVIGLTLAYSVAVADALHQGANPNSD